MYKILYQEELTTNINLFKIEAPAVAKKAQAGQFVIVMPDEKSERIPLTLADWDEIEGTITVVFMEVGTTTNKLATLKVGDSVFALVGPLGVPTHIEKFGTVVCVAGGFAIATLVPIARAMRAAGNRVISIIGFRTKSLVFWEDRIRKVSDEVIVITDDGTYGLTGLVTKPLKELLERDKDIQRVIAIGPTPMMKFSSKTTEPFGVKTVVSFNPIMVDGTGMCGCCRVNVGGQTKFTCVDGPDFDGHLVDWDQLMIRQKSYLYEEKQSTEFWPHQCQAERGQR